MRLRASHKKMRDKLSKLSGAQFDREYIKGQEDDHAKTLALLRKQEDKGRDTDLRDFAGNTVSTVEEHLHMVRDIRSGKTDRMQHQAR